MFRAAFSFWLGCCVFSWGCRTSEPQPRAGRAPEPPGAISATPGLPTAATSTASAAPSSSAPKLARLHPLAKEPYPEGGDQATLCAAIESKEPDVWLRFGHFLPVYERGVLYVLDRGPELKEKLVEYMAREYVPGWNARLASCGERTLVYIRVMYGDGEHDGKPFGRIHLAQQLEKKFGLRVLENIQLEGDTARLGAYCRADAELCDGLLKLHPGNKGLGLCSHGIVPCLNAGRGSEEELQAACKKTPRSVLACSKYYGTRQESFECTAQIQAALCPSAVTSP